ncbi:AAA family ATPase [Pseudahrensia aquimaris]|uniref:AAA family ATPase n=1 Tax=Pseudahrensia aquimaris TaxID=744461 RepID=A0ABW3FGJ9_9HYPH
MSDTAQDPNAISMAVPVDAAHGDQPMAPDMQVPQGYDPMAVPGDPAAAAMEPVSGLAMPAEPTGYTDPVMQANPMPAGLAMPVQDPAVAPTAPPMADAMSASMVNPAMAAPVMPTDPDQGFGEPLQPQGYAPEPAQDFAYADPAMSDASVFPEAESTAQEAPMGGYAYVGPEEDMSGVRPVPRVSIQAFCETEAVAGIIDRAANDRRMAKAHVSVQLGGIPAATDYYQTAATPNLIIVESQLRDEGLLQLLQGLAEVCDEGSNVMVVGHANDVQLYRELMSRGVSEYLVAPITMVQLMTIVNDLFVNPDSEPLGNTMTFIGAKGGVGSSTLAHNIAFAISSEFESDVILADMDLPFGTANIDFDQDPAQGIADAVFSSDRIDDTYLDRLLAKCSDHLSLLAAPSTLEREYDFGPQDFMQLLEVAQRGTPNVVLDMPHVWTGWSRNVLAASDRVVITAMPDLASLRNTKNLLETLKEIRPNDEAPLIVLNQVNVPKRPEISIDDFMEPLELKAAAVIPFEPALFGNASNNGQMIAEADPKSEVAAAIQNLAHTLTNRRDASEKPGKKTSSLLSFLSRKKA